MSQEIEKKIHRAGGWQSSGCMTRTTKSTTGENVFQETHISGTGTGILNDGTKTSITTSNDQQAILGDKFKDVRGSDNEYVAGQKMSISRGDYNLKVGSLNAAAANVDAMIKEGIHKEKNKFEIQRTDYKSMYNSPDQTKGGAPKPCPECSQGKKYPAINSNIEEEINKLVATPLDWLLNFVSGLAKAIGINIELPDVKIKFPGLELIPFPPTSQCKVCQGKGESLWSYEGDWVPEPGKEKIKQMYEEAGTQLAGAEESMGEGGNHLVEVSRNMMINVGMATNKMSDIRIDDKGKKSPYGVTIGEERVYQKQAESPLVEKVHVDNLMGGTFTLYAGNGANFVVGGRGLNFDCFGSCRFSGSRVDIAGAQVNIASKNEVNLRSDSRLALEGKMLSMKSGSGQVLMENNLGVSGNLIVVGGAHIEGELFVNHVTAPMEIQATEKSPLLYGQSHPKDEKKVGFIKRGTMMLCEISVIAPGIANAAGPVAGISPFCYVKILDVGGNNIPIISSVPGESEPDKSSVYVYPHNHLFRNLPLTLTGSNKEMRQTSTALENKEPYAASEVKFEPHKGPESTRGKNIVDKGMWEKNAAGGEDMEPYFVNMESGSESTVEGTGEPAEQQATPYKTPQELAVQVTV
jgi:hypothetical protein